jgi:hypothetical protein
LPEAETAATEHRSNFELRMPQTRRHPNDTLPASACVRDILADTLGVSTFDNHRMNFSDPGLRRIAMLVEGRVNRAFLDRGLVKDNL